MERIKQFTYETLESDEFGGGVKFNCPKCEISIILWEHLSTVDVCNCGLDWDFNIEVNIIGTKY